MALNAGFTNRKMHFFCCRSDKDPENRTFAYFYKQIDLLSHNYFSFKNDYIDYEQSLEFQSFLDNWDTEEVFYNTKLKMQMVCMINCL